jgi:hypothetical protein
MTARLYAQIVGVVLLLLGVLGLLLGERALLGLVNIDIVEDIIHLLTGGILAYVGFGQRDEGVTRNVVIGLSVIYLLVGLLGFVLPDMAGFFPTNTALRTTSSTWHWAPLVCLSPSPRVVGPRQAKREKDPAFRGIDPSEKEGRVSKDPLLA